MAGNDPAKRTTSRTGRSSIEGRKFSISSEVSNTGNTRWTGPERLAGIEYHCGRRGGRDFSVAGAETLAFSRGARLSEIPLRTGGGQSSSPVRFKPLMVGLLFETGGSVRRYLSILRWRLLWQDASTSIAVASYASHQERRASPVVLPVRGSSRHSLGRDEAQVDRTMLASRISCVIHLNIGQLCGQQCQQRKLDRANRFHVPHVVASPRAARGR